MSYRIRFTMPDGRTGLWAHEYQTRDAAQAAIDDRLADTGFAYTVEEAPEPKPEPMTTKSYQIRCTGPSGSTFLFRDVYATRCLANEIRDSVERWSGGCFKYTVEEIHDAAAHDLDAAKRSVARLESTLAMVQASWAASVASEDAWRARSRQHCMEAASSNVRLDRAVELADAMHRAMTTAQAYLSGEWGGVKVAMAEWEVYKESLAASLSKAPSVPVGASDAPGEGGDNGEGSK